MKNKERKAPASAEVQEAVKVLLDHGIGAHEFASLAGVAYPIPKEKEPVLLTTKQAAEKFGLSVWTLRRWCHEGKLRPVTGCKSWMFKPDAIEGALRYL
jgi:excisionase family DNA binding protein